MNRKNRFYAVFAFYQFKKYNEDRDNQIVKIDEQYIS